MPAARDKCFIEMSRQEYNQSCGEPQFSLDLLLSSGLLAAIKSRLTVMFLT